MENKNSSKASYIFDSVTVSNKSITIVKTNNGHKNILDIELKNKTMTIELKGHFYGIYNKDDYKELFKYYKKFLVTGKEDRTLYGDQECCCCFAETVDEQFAFTCGHKNICKTCLNKMPEKICPLCRAEQDLTKPCLLNGIFKKTEHNEMEHLFLNFTWFVANYKIITTNMNDRELRVHKSKLKNVIYSIEDDNDFDCVLREGEIEMN